MIQEPGKMNEVHIIRDEDQCWSVWSNYTVWPALLWKRLQLL